LQVAPDALINVFNRLRFTGVYLHLRPYNSTVVQQKSYTDVCKSIYIRLAMQLSAESNSNRVQ